MGIVFNYSGLNESTMLMTGGYYDPTATYINTVTAYGVFMGESFREKVQIVPCEDGDGFGAYVDGYRHCINPAWFDTMDDAIDYAKRTISDIIPCPMLRINLRIDEQCERLSMNADFDLQMLEDRLNHWESFILKSR